MAGLPANKTSNKKIFGLDNDNDFSTSPPFAGFSFVEVFDFAVELSQVP
jgi:hypothetical protein